VGVGIGGSFIAARFAELTQAVQNRGLLEGLPPGLADKGLDQIEGLLRPDVLSALPDEIRLWVQASVGQGVTEVFWTVLVAAIACLFFCLLIPSEIPPAGQRKTV
jgi:hypothetical protein